MYNKLRLDTESMYSMIAACRMSLIGLDTHHLRYNVVVVNMYIINKCNP